MLGPSGTVTFHPLLLTQFLTTSLITRNDIQRALITRTKGTGVKESTRIVLLDERIPYTTRCYEQTQPYRVWLWVLSEFGASHVLTQYCFDDLLQWVGESCAGGTGRGDVELNGVVAPFLEAGVSVLPRHVQFLGRAARWKWVAPLPAVVMSVAFRGIVQRIERGKSGGVEKVEEERYGARASASVGAHKRGSTSRDRISSRNSSAFTSPTSPASNTTARNVVWWGDAQRLDPSPPSSTTRSKPQTGSLDYSISPTLSESPSIPTTPVTSTAPNETVSDTELHLWIEALKSLFADQATIHSIKHADAEWFKDYKQEMEAQDRKELLSVGIPLKKSWSGGGLAKRQSEFGSGWWDMLIGIGGNGAMSGRVKALGARTAGRPGRFLEVSQEMLKKLTLAVKK
ncbi:hypothetical protein HDU79_003142 [Rhizoclosmatium sp. JEL0117]|nr:hypothetical protein HDU79_003142 [Rhizoclosmatium sp. JEL0117]